MCRAAGLSLKSLGRKKWEGSTIIPVALSEFSEDGQWWWDGQRWIATSQVVIPELRVGNTDGLERMKRYRQLGTATFVMGMAGIGSRLVESTATALLVPFLVLQRPTFRAYRVSLLEQVGAATTYLLGAGEPMVAGEVSVWLHPLAGIVAGNLAVSVTSRHVVVLQINVSTGLPEHVALAARPWDVNIVFRWGLFWGYPTLYVCQPSRVWPIRGAFGILKPEPVLAAWRQSLGGGVPTAG